LTAERVAGLVASKEPNPDLTQYEKHYDLVSKFRRCVEVQWYVDA